MSVVEKVFEFMDRVNNNTIYHPNFESLIIGKPGSLYDFSIRGIVSSGLKGDAQ